MKHIFFLACYFFGIGIQANAQVSAVQLPVTKNWHSASFPVFVTNSGSGDYQSQVAVTPIGDTVGISGEVKTFSGTGLKTNSVTGLKPGTEYGYKHVFTKDTFQTVFTGSFKTDQLPPKPIIKITEEPFIGISDLLIIINSSYPVRVWGLYDGDTETETYLHNSGLDTIVVPLVTPTVRKYPYCIIFQYSDSVSADQDTVICDEIIVTTPDPRPAPELSIESQSADCGTIEVITRIRPVVGDTAMVSVLISSDQVNYFLIDSAKGLYWPITIVTKFPGLEGGTKYYLKIVGTSKDGVMKEIKTTLAMPAGESPTIAITPKVVVRLVEFNFAGWAGCSGSMLTISVSGSTAIDTAVFVGSDQYVGTVDFFLNPGNYSWRAVIKNRYGEQVRSGNFIVSDTATSIQTQEVRKIPPNAFVVVIDTGGRQIGSTTWSEISDQKNPLLLQGFYLILVPNENYVEKRIFVR